MFLLLIIVQHNNKQQGGGKSWASAAAAALKCNQKSFKFSHVCIKCNAWSKLPPRHGTMEVNFPPSHSRSLSLCSCNRLLHLQCRHFFPFIFSFKKIIQKFHFSFFFLHFIYFRIIFFSLSLLLFYYCFMLSNSCRGIFLLYFIFLKTFLTFMFMPWGEELSVFFL